MSNVPAGWYDDPQLANTRRYWDGQAWTDHRQETQPASTTSSTPTPRGRNGSSLTDAGYILAVLLPPIGLVLGLISLGSQPRHGWRIIALAVVVAVVSFFIYNLR